MSDIVRLLMTTEGRISRKSWWRGAVVLLVASLVLSLLLSFVGLGLWSNMSALQTEDLQVATAALAASMQSAAWGGLITFLIIVYPYYALSMKRRHDRNNDGLDLKIYCGLTVVNLLLQAFGIGYTQVPVAGVEGMSLPMPGILLTIFGFGLAIYGLYMLVVLGFLRGTAERNQFGPAPLDTTGATAA